VKTGRGAHLAAGAAKVDISPELGIQIAGDIGRRRPCTALKEPIYARALAFESGQERFCVLTLDVLAIDNPWSDEIRRRVQASFGLPAGSLLIHALQNHAAPSIGDHFCREECRLIPDSERWLRGGDQAYNEPAMAGAVTAVGQALANLVPVTLSFGRATDGRVSFNRRFVMRDGRVVCHPPDCSPEILHAEGLTDPEVSLAVFTDEAGQIVSALMHHTCHPCHGFDDNELLAGWPGAWCREMEAYFGPSCIPLVLNGCCGNIHHHNHLAPDWKDDHLWMGRRLAESSFRALARPISLDPFPFAWKRRILPVPHRRIPARLLAEARKLLRKHPEPLWKDAKHIRVEWDWVYAVGIMDIADERRSSPDYPCEIQALRLGNLALLALMGEPFVEAQLRIKRESPFPFTQVAHMCNGDLGYVPTRRAFAGGGYETRIGRVSRLEPRALEMVEAAALDLLRELRSA